MKPSKIPNLEKFESIISELLRRGIVVLMHRPTRWGYVVDAVIPSTKIVILKMPDMSRQNREAMSMFRDMMNRLECDGYKVIMVPKNSMNNEQIGAFCDRIIVESSLAAA